MAERRLSTGARVTLPFDCTVSFAGVCCFTRWGAMDDAMPPGLTPVRVGPDRGVLALAGVEYHDVDPLESYREFAVVVPVTRRALSGVPLPGGKVSGYVPVLPVSTEESVALGREVWGFPKEVAPVDFQTATERRGWRVELRETDRTGVTLSVRRGKAKQRAWTTAVYTLLDGALHRTRVSLDGPIHVGAGGARLDLGSGPTADWLDAVDTGPPVVRFSAHHATLRLGAPMRVGDVIQ